MLVDAAFKAMDSDERYIAIVVGVAQHWFSSRIFWCLPSDLHEYAHQVQVGARYTPPFPERTLRPGTRIIVTIAIGFVRLFMTLPMYP